jgi:large subunit ribosomal protein L21
MYAVIASGGKQYKVAEGQVLKLEIIDTDAGQEVEFGQVLLLADGDNITVGAPFVTGAKVKAEVVSHGRHDKIEIIKFRRRKHHMKKMGHRQNYTEVKITSINNTDKK